MHRPSAAPARLALLAGVAFSLASSACFIPVTPRRSPPGSDVVPPQVQLSGTFANAPFVGRSALMVRHNEPATASSSSEPGKVQVLISEIVVFDRPMTCAEERSRRSDLSGNDRSLTLDLRGRWPLPPGSRWTVTHAQDLRSVEWTGSFKRNPRSGLIADGDLEVLNSSDRDGTVRVRLRSINGDGSHAEGVVPFLVCP